MDKSVLMVDPATVELEPEPIPESWILSGTPKASSKTMARSHDWTSHTVVWECTAGRFQWHYATDESILVVSGEAFMLEEDGGERRIGPGDLGFFPAGTSCTWRVKDRIRKVAVLREPLWRPLGLALKVWHKFLRVAGFSGKSPLTVAFAILALQSFS